MDKNTEKFLMKKATAVMPAVLLIPTIVGFCRNVIIRKNVHKRKAESLIADIKNETRKNKRKRLLDQFYQEALLYNNSRA